MFSYTFLMLTNVQNFVFKTFRISEILKSRKKRSERLFLEHLNPSNYWFFRNLFVVIKLFWAASDDLYVFFAHAKNTNMPSDDVKSDFLNKIWLCQNRKFCLISIMGQILWKFSIFTEAYLGEEITCDIIWWHIRVLSMCKEHE